MVGSIRGAMTSIKNDVTLKKAVLKILHRLINTRKEEVLTGVMIWLEMSGNGLIAGMARIKNESDAAVHGVMNDVIAAVQIAVDIGCLPTIARGEDSVV